MKGLLTSAAICDAASIPTSMKGMIMKNLFVSAAILCLGCGVASAAQPLTIRQMDKVTAAGFTAVAVAGASAVGSYTFAATSTFASVKLVNPTLHEFQSVSASSSVSMSR